MQNRKFLPLRRSSARLGSLLLLGGSLLAAACETSQFCAEGACNDDGGGGEKPAGGTPGSGGKPATGGKPDGSGSGGLGGAENGAGGAFGGMAGSEATGGKDAGTGGQIVDLGELEGSVAKDLFDVVAGGSVKVPVSLKRSGGFEGTVLVTLDGEPFTAGRVFASANQDEVTLNITADSETPQGYYEASIIAESSDGSLSVEIPLNIRVRGAPGTLDLTFGDHAMPWVGEGTEAEVAVDDAGYVYLRNQETIFRFDRHGILDESFGPEGLGEELGPMIGMEDGVLIGTRGPSTPDQLIHFLGTGAKNPSWTGSAPPNILLQNLPMSLHRQGDRVVVGADYAYPFSWVQVFSMQGPIDSSFEQIYFYGSSGATDVYAQLDSQGRVLATRQNDATFRRLLPDGSLDTTFADNGALVLAGGSPDVLDFAVLSDDGLAILVRTNEGFRLALWTPTGSGGGAIAYHNLPDESFFGLLRLDGDRLLTSGRAGDRWPPTVIRLFTKAGVPVAPFGDNGALNLNQTSVPHYAPLPDFDRLGWEEPAYDPKANRLIAHGTDLGKVYFYSIWL